MQQFEEIKSFGYGYFEVADNAGANKNFADLQFTLIAPRRRRHAHVRAERNEAILNIWARTGVKAPARRNSTKFPTLPQLPSQLAHFPPISARAQKWSFARSIESRTARRPKSPGLTWPAAHFASAFRRPTHALPHGSFTSSPRPPPSLRVSACPSSRRPSSFRVQRSAFRPETSLQPHPQQPYPHLFLTAPPRKQPQQPTPQHVTNKRPPGV